MRQRPAGEQRMSWHSFLLIGENGRARDRVERGLVEAFSATRIVVADGAEAALALLGDGAVDCVAVVAPAHARRWGESVRSVLRGKPSLAEVPFLVFDGSQGRRRGRGAARVFY